METSAADERHLWLVPNSKIGPEFLVKQGMNIGIAYRFINDSKEWFKLGMRKRSTEGDYDEAISDSLS